ncbi:MAG: D-glycero-beta-D-manno-heptose 1-phosphate adenylyltransferase [Armatimonadota bacterium]|nr:D-glycero-beta-D-manno-heptose 1-phosphate adenylyltransferase [Armatimonadota bacterium]
MILDPNELAECVAERQKRGERVVFTNGVFDILHVGHLRYLAEARALGDALLVAVNTDASVKSFKGDLRPIVPQAERLEMLDGLRSVDYVTLFDTRTPVPLIERVRPAVYVKGGDYTEDQLPEAAVVRAYGGDVQILSLIAGRSSTNIIAKICAAYGSPRAPEG